MKPMIVIAGAALALAACGPGTRVDRGGKVTLKGADGTMITASKQAPDNLPFFARPYQGAEVTSAVVMGDKVAIVTYTVAAPPETVMAFHKTTAADAKLDIIQDSWGAVERSGSHVISFRDEAGRSGYTVTVQPISGKTQVTLLYGR